MTSRISFNFLKPIFSIFVLTFSSALFSQTLLTETFDYPEGEYFDQHNWFRFLSSSDSVQLDPNGLTYAGYLSGGKGKSAKLDGNSTADRELWYRHFEPTSTGSIYLSFLLNVSDYANVQFNSPIALGPGNTALYSRFYMTKIDDSNYKMGLSQSGEPATFTSALFSMNQTYLVIVKYEIVEGENNDLISLFSFSNGNFPSEEPVNPSIAAFTSGNGDPSPEVPLQNVVLFSVENSSANNLRIDEIRVAKTWNDLKSTSVKSQAIKSNSFGLLGNYPNPFNPSTEINFNLPQNGKTIVSIYNYLGQKIETIFSGELIKGRNSISWNSGNLTSGIYFYSVQFNNEIQIGKMTLVK